VTLELVAFDVVLASIPMVFVASITWRLVWPRWKLFAKLLVHPCIYVILSVYLGHWSVGIAWIHQGLLGLGGHIWFSRKHGFTWYAVEDSERYVSLSKKMVGSLRTEVRAPHDEQTGENQPEVDAARPNSSP
jgi:hypothetical protein